MLPLIAPQAAEPGLDLRIPMGMTSPELQAQVSLKAVEKPDGRAQALIPDPVCSPGAKP